MKSMAFIALLSVLMLSACSIQIPGPFFEDEYVPVTVRLAIEPDDAEVFLDGRLIGEAYEFASLKTAIRLSSRNHRLTFQKDGYYETVVDLDSYRGNRITLWLDLKTIPEGQEGTAPAVDQATPPPETEKFTPPPAEEEEEAAPAARYALILTVEPAEATLYVNDRFWGIAPQNGQIGRIAFAEKEIKLDVYKPGFKPFSKMISLSEQGEELTVRLEAEKK